MDHPTSRAYADNGKAPQVFVQSKVDHWATEEHETYIDLNVFFDDLGLQRPKLARRLLKAIILLRDWKMTKTRRLNEVIPSLYLSLLKIFFSCLS